MEKEQEKGLTLGQMEINTSEISSMEKEQERDLKFGQMGEGNYGGDFVDGKIEGEGIYTQYMERY